MAKVLSYEAIVRGGLTAETKLVLPKIAGDPTSPQDGWLWIDTGSSSLKYRQGGTTYTLGLANALDAEQVQDIVGAMSVGGNNIGITYNDTTGTITFNVQGLTSAQISDFATAAQGAITGTDTATADISVVGGAVSVSVLDSPLLGGQAGSYYTNTDNHVDGATNHVFTASDDAKLSGVAAGATANSPDAYLLSRANHTGTQIAATISDFVAAARGAISITDTGTLDLSYAAGVISGAVLDSPLLAGNNAAYYRNADNQISGTTNHVFTAVQDTKLAGIATGATANSPDAYLLSRANHTGTQLAATISDFSTAVAALSIDATTLNGLTSSQIQSAVTAAIVDAAPGTLDTLNELAAALGDDPNFATTITTLVNTRSRNFTAALAGGALTETVTHNLNTRNLLAQVFVDGADYEDEDYIIRRPTLNTVLVVSEAVNIPTGRRIVIHAVGNGA